jgi:hypothetical protein
MTTARFAGLLTWTGFEIADGGLYLFTAEAPPGEPLAATLEGELRWWRRQQAVASPQVVSNLHIILPYLLNPVPPQMYHMTYQAGVLSEHTIRPLPDGLRLR